MGVGEWIHKTMTRCVIKELKRCPKCKSSSIYKRVRAMRIVRETRKRNRNYIENRTKMYRCKECKHEFDSPIIE